MRNHAFLGERCDASRSIDGRPSSWSTALLTCSQHSCARKRQRQYHCWFLGSLSICRSAILARSRLFLTYCGMRIQVLWRVALKIWSSLFCWQSLGHSSVAGLTAPPALHEDWQLDMSGNMLLLQEFMEALCRPSSWWKRKQFFSK